MKRSSTPALHVKQKRAAIFRALQADARDYAGGLPALAQQLGRNYASMRNALNPTNLDSEPTFELVLDVIESTGGARTVPAVAWVGDQTALPAPGLDEGTCEEVTAAFMKLVGKAGKLKVATVQAMADGRICTAERDDLADLLDKLIASGVAMRALLRGR